jgi:hypothetical protein
MDALVMLATDDSIPWWLIALFAVLSVVMITLAYYSLKSLEGIGEDIEAGVKKLKNLPQEDAAKRQATINKVQQMVDQGVPAMVCPKCHGLGKSKLRTICTKCNGNGWIDPRIQ